MHTLKLIAVGDFTGVVLPQDVMAKLKVEKGDTLTLTETPDGYRLTPSNSEFEAQRTAARQIMKKRHNVLGELAK